VEQSGDESDVPQSAGARPISIAVTADPREASTELKSEDFHLKVDDSTVADDGEAVVSSTTTFHVSSDEPPQSKVGLYVVGMVTIFVVYSSMSLVVKNWKMMTLLLEVLLVKMDH